MILALFLPTAMFARGGGDSLHTKNSLQFDVFGKAFVAGFTYERNLNKAHPEKHARAFWSLNVSAAWPGYDDFLAGVGVNRNWFLTISRKLILSSGLTVAGLVNLHPTPKALRDYWDSIQYYGGNYVNPVEPWLIGDIAMKYIFKRMFVRTNFVAFLSYDRISDSGFHILPWGGISIGIFLNNKR